MFRVNAQQRHGKLKRRRKKSNVDKTNNHRVSALSLFFPLLCKTLNYFFSFSYQPGNVNLSFILFELSAF